jgi:hypothetical protein
MPRWGVATPGASPGARARISAVPVPDDLPRARGLSLVFDPRTFVREATGPVTSRLLTKAQRARAWSTPRKTQPMCNVLTERSVRDLPTQVRFERGTPAHLRDGVVNPAFVEWLMGMGGPRALRWRPIARQLQEGVALDAKRDPRRAGSTASKAAEYAGGVGSGRRRSEAAVKVAHTDKRGRIGTGARKPLGLSETQLNV